MTQAAQATKVNLENPEIELATANNTPPIEIGADERIAIIGATGSGKTVLARYLLSFTLRAIVVDPKHSFELEGFKGLRRRPFLSPAKEFHYLYRPRMAEDKKLAEFLAYFWDTGDTIIYIDELSTLAEGYKMSIDVLSEIARTGRERNVGLWVTMQRPRFVPKLFLTESEQLFIFALRNAEDRQYVAGYAGEEVREPIDKFNFWYVSAHEDKIKLLHLNIDNNRIQEISQGVENAE